jgi:hypothetical protein
MRRSERLPADLSCSGLIVEVPRLSDWRSSRPRPRAAWRRAGPVQFGTAGRRAAGYTRSMSSENAKMLFFAAWPIAVFLVALAIGVPSVLHWLIVAVAAAVPPLVVRHFWRLPEQTVSESIRDARR